jgi:hypothetical protein
MTFDNEDPITYWAAFCCGHGKLLETANVDDTPQLQDIALQRLCPECAYRIGAASLMLRRRASDGADMRVAS